MHFRLQKTSIILFIGACVLALTGMPAPCRAAEWQWSVPVVGGTDKAGLARAFLWIAPSCRKVRGVVFTQNDTRGAFRERTVALLS